MSATQEAGDIFGQGRGPAHSMLRSPTVLIASVGLWGMNVFFFKLFRIDYVKVLKHDLLKLEEIDQQHHTTKETSSMANPDDMGDEDGRGDDGEDGTTDHPPTTGANGTSAPRTPTKFLIQRQSNAAGVAAVASAAPTQNNSNSSTPPSQSAVVDEDEDFDEYVVLVDEEQMALPDKDSDVGNSPHHLIEPDSVITWGKLVALSVVLLLLLHTTYYWWLDVLHGGTIGAVLMFYTLVVVAITTPFRCTRWLRRATVIVLQRTYELINPRCHCITNDGVTPPRFIPFVDVFYADAMCSMSKVFFDWGMLLHMASHYPHPVPAAAHNIVIPSAFAAVPYVIRARQCLIMYTVGRLKQEKNRFSHLWNALKYSSSIFPLCLSAYQQTIPKRAAKDLDTLLIVLMIINSSYSLYWDIVMDWGMWQENPLGVAFCETGSGKSAMVANPHKAATPTSCIYSFMRNRLRFGLAMSALILFIDCVLRFSWTLRFAQNSLFPSADAFVLTTQFLEVFRRALWNLLRVEWENIKHSRNKPSASSRPKVGRSKSEHHHHHHSVHHLHHKKQTSGLVDEELTSFLPAAGKLNKL